MNWIYKIFHRKKKEKHYHVIFGEGVVKECKDENCSCRKNQYTEKELVEIRKKIDRVLDEAIINYLYKN